MFKRRARFPWFRRHFFSHIGLNLLAKRLFAETWTLMAARNFTVGQDKEGVYLLEGELSIHDLDEIRSFLDKALQGPEEVCLSLAKVRFIDMAALQLLIAFRKRSEPATRLRIRAVSPEVEHLLSLCGLRTALL